MNIVWIIGARGFLGRHTAAAFDRAGFSVAGMGLGGADDAAVEDLPLMSIAGRPAWVEAAVSTEALDMLERVSGPPDIVVHAAGSGAVGPSFTDPLRDFRLAVESTAVVLDHMRRRAPQARFVLPSSAAVYGVRPEGLMEEDLASAPVSPYGAHKLAAEALCRGAHAAYGQKISIIRYFSLYGPTLRKQLLFDLGQRLRSGPARLSMSGTGRETRDLLHAYDAASLALLAGTVDESKPFLVVNGGTGRAASVREVCELLARALGLETGFDFNGEVRAGDPPHMCAGTRAVAALGFTPLFDLESGIATYAAWLNEIWAQEGARS